MLFKLLLPYTYRRHLSGLLPSPHAVRAAVAPPPAVERLLPLVFASCTKVQLSLSSRYWCTVAAEEDSVRVHHRCPSARDCLEGLAQFGKPESTVAKRDVSRSSILAHRLNVDRPFVRRGYSSEASLRERDNGCISLDSSRNSSVEENSSQCEPAAGGVNLGAKISERHNLAMIYTCTVCQTRSAKTMSRETYEKGVVIVRCGGCKNLHLIADRLGWFGEPGSVEDFLKQKGVEVRKGTEESYEFSVEDLAGWSRPNKE